MLGTDSDDNGNKSSPNEEVKKDITLKRFTPLERIASKLSNYQATSKSKNHTNKLHGKRTYQEY